MQDLTTDDSPKQYDMLYIPDLSNIPNVYPSPERDEEEDEAEEVGGKASKPATKRKRENRYKNAPPAVLSVSAAIYAGNQAQAPQLTRSSVGGLRTARLNGPTGNGRTSG